MISKKIARWTAPLVAFFTGGVLLLMLHTHGHVVEPLYLRYLLVWIPVILFLVVLARKDLPSPERFAQTGLSSSIPNTVLSAGILLAFMVLYLFSSSADYPWFYFLSWLPRNTFGFHLLESQLGRFVFLTALLTPLVMGRAKWINFALPALLFFVIAGSTYVFIRETGGAFLYHDDHSSSLYRLWEFCSTFPRQINYNPFWNGGQVSNHPALTGTSAFGLFILPFCKWLPIEQCYTPLIAVVFIGIVPLMALFSLRIAGSNWTAAIIAGILALGTGQFYFLWLLFYGTVGAVFSAACFMPVSACLFRVLFLNRREKWCGLVLIIGACLMLMWPPNAVLAAVLLVVLLLNIRRISQANLLFLVICGAIILLLQWTQIFVILKEILQSSYETAGASSAAGPVPFSRVFLNGYGNLVDYIRMGHPLLIFLGLGGVITAVNGNVRRWFLPFILLLLLIAGWGPEFMPGFQLFRIIIPLFFVAVIPAALAANELLISTGSKLALLRAAVVAILIVGALNTIMLFNNGSQAPYETLSPDGHAMTEWVRSNAPEGTRVLFAGSTVHGYEGGHVAFMQYLTGREMMACDYYHFSPAVVEYDYPPRPWRGNAELFSRFLDLYNVSVITTLRDNWKNYLRSRPAEYLEGKSFGESNALAFFLVAPTPPSPSAGLRAMAGKPDGSPKASLFLIGDGKVKAGFNRIEVELTGTNEQAVIKYNWQPGLFCDRPVEIFPYQAGPGIRFIGMNPHGQKYVVIRYK